MATVFEDGAKFWKIIYGKQAWAIILHTLSPLLQLLLCRGIIACKNNIDFFKCDKELILILLLCNIIGFASLFQQPFYIMQM